MDPATLLDVRESAQRLQFRVERLAQRLPDPGEPSAVYALRSRIFSADLKTATVALAGGQTAWVLYIETTIDMQRLYYDVLRPLQETVLRGTLPPAGPAHPLLPQSTPVEALDDQTTALLDGQAVVLLGGTAAAVDCRKFPSRNVSEPTTEQTVIGPKQAFVEEVQSNIGAVRQRLRDGRLRVEKFTVGRRSRTQVALIYLEDVAKPDLVELTRQGLASIDTDFIRTGEDVASFLFQKTLTTIPLTDRTERPDRAAAAIAAGRICLVVDGTPFVILVPATLLQTIQDSEVALPGPIITAFVRFLRGAGELIAVSAAGLYVALMTADTQVMPTPLALAMSGSRNGVPYPVLTETLVMLFVIDVFTEATTQAPGGVGNTLSIVGTLIIGQMVVQARLASSLMMIVVAATALGSFLTLKYPYSYTLRIWKYPITLLAGVAGLFGWLAGILLLFTHLAGLKSAGVPYLSPVGPLNQRTLFQQGIVRVLRPFIRRRPGTWDPQDIRVSGEGGA